MFSTGMRFEAQLHPTRGLGVRRDDRDVRLPAISGCPKTCLLYARLRAQDFLPTPLPLGPLPGARYPDSRLESMKKPKVSFGPTGFPAFAGTMAVERVATGFRWAEGPVYFPAGRYVLFSDIPNNRIMRFS